MKVFFSYIVLLLGVFFLSRGVLLLENNIELDMLFFIYALRMDTIVISTLLLIPVILYSVNLLFLTRFYFAISFFIVVYLEIANYFFFEEFNTRLNYIFIEYLEYPESIFNMLWVSYKYHLMVIIPSLVLISFFIFRYLADKLEPSKVLKKLLILPLILILLGIGIRSSFDSSTPNQSFYSYSNSPIKNDIVNNSLFSLAYAYHLSLKDKVPNYGKVDNDLISQIHRINHHKEYINSETLLYKQTSNSSKKEKIVLVLMESFGSSYVGSLGGTLTTPYFDDMSKKGFFCSNMYSSSNRSNRGFEAVLSSLYPVYSDSYLKLPKSQNAFWTIATTMKKEGYKTVFLYGGDSKFDNMKGFALNNGFDKVIDKFDFDSSIKRFTWGVSDEELYKKANEIVQNTKKPIFLVLFSLSSHKPFDYPDGKIKLYEKAPKESFTNSIKYADFALGSFYQHLKQQAFFKNGLLTVVADHNAHMFGDQKISVNEYKIPALFLSDDIKPYEFKGVTHQIDIAPTLISLSGINVEIPAMGNDLTKVKESSALIFSKGMFAFLQNDGFILYEQNSQPKTYNFQYKILENNTKMIEQGLNFIYGSNLIYNKQIHKDTH